MIIKSLELSDFRNYETLSISFDKGTNILFGDNAQGKTNILSLKQFMYLPLQNPIREAKTKKSLISIKKRHISELILKKRM